MKLPGPDWSCSLLARILLVREVLVPLGCGGADDAVS